MVEHRLISYLSAGLAIMPAMSFMIWTQYVVAANPHDSNKLREDLDKHGNKSVIPNRSNRKQPFGFSKLLYKLRQRIEAAFNRLKDFRIATRYE
jgi:hypothetical protein